MKDVGIIVRKRKGGDIGIHILMLNLKPMLLNERDLRICMMDANNKDRLHVQLLVLQNLAAFGHLKKTDAQNE